MIPAIDLAGAHIAHDLAYDQPLVSCRFHPSGEYVVAGSEGFTLLRFDLKSGKRSLFPSAHESWVHALAFHPSGQKLLSGGCDGRIVVWTSLDATPTPERTVEAHAGWVNSLAISADGSHAASAGNDRLVRIWHLESGRLVAELPGHERPVYRVAYVPGGKFLVSADLLGRVVQWELATQKEVRRLDAAKLYKYEGGQGVDYGGVRDVAFAPDHSKLVCSGLIEASNPLGAVSIPAAILFDWISGTEGTLHRPKETVAGVGWGVRYHPSGEFFVMASGGTAGGFLWFFKAGQAQETHKFALPNTARDLDISPDGLNVATAHHDGHLRITGLYKKT
jgi:WD40 repeat protein